MGRELCALAALLDDVQWPPWTGPRFDTAIGRLRHTIDKQLDLHEDALPTMARRLGLDLEVLEAMAGEAENVQRWVTVLAGPECLRWGGAEVLAALLGVHLFPDELAYLGMLARAIGPAERAAAAS